MSENLFIQHRAMNQKQKKAKEENWQEAYRIAQEIVS